MTGDQDILSGLPALMTRDEVASFLGLSPTTLARWWSEGTGPTVTKIGRAVRYRRGDLQQWLDSSAIAPQVHLRSSLGQR